MNGRDALLDQHDDLARVLRSLYDAALAARPYVAAEAVLANSGHGHAGHAGAPQNLDALDGALADAGELLSRVRS